ncbi:hypothetical protein [Actinocorallia longicatena]|uniref:O-antigen/teichoic acid export membrane protein n=1 Tax=Actinocorallia longicatena TaxID=111803 RepID=A0ABP6QK27_9ACTN
MSAVRTAPTIRTGALTMGGGLVLLGLSASVYLVVSARAVGPDAFSSLSTLWTLIYTFGIGAFLPFEQELGRAHAHRTALGTGTRPLVVRVAAAAGAVLAALLTAGALLAPALVPRLFDGAWTAAGALALALGVMAAQYVTRGVFAGSSRFGWYSAQLGVEGVVRMAACAALLAWGVHSAAPYFWLLALAPLLALLLTLPGLRGAVPAGPPAPWSELSENLGWLLLGCLCAQGVANAAMVALKLLSPHDDTAGQFLAAFVIARVPLFLFQGVQAVLLPGLSAALATGDRTAFRAKLRGVLAATAAVGGAGVLGAALLGPWLLRLLFGPEFTLGRVHLVVLAAATALYMVAQVFQSALVSLGRHRDNALSWLAALGVFVLACALPLPPLARVELALMLSCATAAARTALRLRSARPGGVTASGAVR